MFFRSRPERPQASDFEPLAPLMEPLEPRLVLYTSSFFDSPPALADMANQANTVVRIQTNQGNIDIELFDRSGPANAPGAPLTTANFLRYLNSGLFEDTFFHRLEANFVLQGGGFRFTGGDAPPRFDEPDKFPSPQNEFHAGRSNIERTLGMAKLPNQPNSATNQFFFNLKDNAHAIDPITQVDNGLDVQNSGFTVFARVIKGWEVVTAISQLSVRNLNNFLSGGTNTAFEKVPLTGPGDSDLVLITDADILKPAGSGQFFSQAVYYPEGFRSGNIDASIELVNQDPNSATPFQIIAHFEGGVRDTVIFTNTLAPGAHWTIPISKAGDPSVNKVRGGTAFAYEVRSARPIGATLIHRDSGATASESFIAGEPFTEDQLKQWSFAHGLKGPGNPSFLVWQNLADEDVTVNVLIYPDGGAPFFISQVVGPRRRGGLNMNDLPSVPDGLFSAQIVSTQAIVAALSQFSVSPHRASTESGTIGGGAFEGVIPGAMIADGEQSIISAMFTGQTPSVVQIDFDFVLSDGTVLPGGAPITLTPLISRRDVSLASLNASLPTEQFFTIRYSVRNAAALVAVSYTGSNLDDTAAMAFQTMGAARALLAGGFTDPTRTDETEIISIYNPFTTGVVAAYRLKFHFTEGTAGEIIIPAGGQGTLGASRRVDINIRDLADVMARIQSGTQFRKYSIEVEADFARGATSVPGALFVQLSRFDETTGTVTFGPTIPSGETPVLFSDPQFN